MVDAASSRLALHPQRKRKFFTDLAHLLDEDPPEIRPLQSAFFGPELDDQYRVNRDASSGPKTSSATQTLLMPSHSMTSDSFESVEFGAPRTKSSGVASFGASQLSSYNESMADSALFLPNNSNNNVGSSQKRSEHHVRFDLNYEIMRGCASLSRNYEALPVTTLINRGIMSEKPRTITRLELVDYYDADRMCELLPCWLQSDGVSCDIHQGAIRRPMLLFCLQALDEFIARNGWMGQQRWQLQACKVARRVFTAMWEADVLGIAPSERDVVLADCVASKTVVTGVALDVWRIIARYWDKYKQNYSHQQELYFGGGSEGRSTHTASKQDLVRALLHIYGMKPSQAMRLVDQDGSDHFNLWKLTDKQLREVAHGLPSIEHLHVGMDYLKCKTAGTSSGGDKDFAAIQRPMISQQDAKTAFSAIHIHLKKWNEKVQMFPCGSFSRGAAFISVLDVLVVIPIPEGNFTSAEIDEKLFDDVVTALMAANVVPKGGIRQLTSTRGACIVLFKNSSILLDLKVYCPPRSWFALLYFTGPEDFVLAFFTALLKQSLREICDTSFECIYSRVTEVMGSKALLAIASEKDLFDFIGRDFLEPADRI
ncbi:hypothetical protein KXD40_001353 [Peronospora effusa]|uniref:DNA polymerase n=1 Tax=Peronospora effusa TaxID=542832 RepID=A0A3M6VTQ8_9STRA|nr:hypothetical protein DD238_000288 [Peronospora effusa]RQM08988.1 hypothetical protein DD237_000454 [Peronospora effusa]UIZ20777.1 hypothetical protein KXD40_001353 [Peronospora effusa]CAI5704354.1 unnamed protein product [Peronospora effusa]